MKAILAGLLFGAWPILMEKSHLPGNVQSLVFAAGVLILVFPFSISGFREIQNPVWMMAVFAGLAGGLGLMVFTSGLSTIGTKNVSVYFVLMIVAQTTVPAVYKIFVDGKGVSIEKGIGFALAIVAAILLTKK